MNEISLFDFDGTELRGLFVDGQPWLIARDICAALGLGNASDAISSLHEDEKGVATTDTLGGPQQVVTVNEPGAYRLIFRSRKPEAERFKRWVFHDVLPAIRETGRYGHPDAEFRQIAPADRIDALGAAVRAGFVPRKQGQRQAQDILADLGLAERPRTIEEERLDIAIRWVHRDRQPGDTFSARELHRGLHGQYWMRTGHDVEAVLADLCETGHVRKLPRPTTMLRGRPPSPRFEVLATRREIGGTL